MLGKLAVILIVFLTTKATRLDHLPGLDVISLNHLELNFKPFQHVLRGVIGTTDESPEEVAFYQCNASTPETLCYVRTHRNETSIVTITHHSEQNVECYQIIHNNPSSLSKDCYDLGSAHWYGGGEVANQTWPIRNESRPRNPYITGDFFHYVYGGVIESLWFNSEGFGLFVDKQTPLFVSYNESGDGKLCFSASYDEYPYTVAGQRQATKILKYSKCSADNVLQLFKYMADKNIDKPKGYPEPRMISSPIWSTWVKFKANIDQEMVLKFAREIQSQNYSGQIEIDDMWESCYGQLEFKKDKFPDPLSMVQQLKAMGFKVSLWIHPFTNVFCDAYIEGSSNNYFVRNATTGKTQQVRWWDGYGGYIDTTNPDAVEWFYQRVDRLRRDYGFDTFKFDAGEVTWNYPGFDFANQELRNSPTVFSTLYAKMASRFGQAVEVRVGYNSQQFPILTRMLDKNSLWGYENGLKSLIPSTLLFGVSGYPFVLPDMIGGNAYQRFPEKELFIRWLQANVFLPSIQFSILPWDYDQETVSISREMVNLHEEYSPLLIKLANQSVSTGDPIIRPLWWIAPKDPVALEIDSEFLVGDKILVAPVLDKGAINRNVYLPSGSWKDANNPKLVYVGPLWLKDYSADLHVLPYFIKVTEK